MKKLFQVELTCPYCQKKFTYNILSFFKAKVECPHCEYDLIVRTKSKTSFLLSLIGFALLVVLEKVLGIYQYGKVATLIYFVVACFGYLVIAYTILCKVKGADSIYVVEMEDPTVLLRKKKNK